MSERLRPHERIRRRSEYLRIQKDGARSHGRYMTLVLLSNDVQVCRLGVAASRKIGGAVRRNRAKRLIREIFRRNKPSLETPGVDVVVIPRPQLLEASFSALEADFRAALKRGSR